MRKFDIAISNIPLILLFQTGFRSQIVLNALASGAQNAPPPPKPPVPFILVDSAHCAPPKIKS